MSSLREQVGVAIRHHRKAKGWTQDDLAAKTSRSVELINRIERGRGSPSFDTLEALAAAMGVPVRDLFGVGPYAVEPGRDDGLVRLISRVSALDPEDLNWVDRLVSVALARKVRGASKVG